MTPRFYSVSDRQVRALARGAASEADLAVLSSGQASKCLSMLALIARDAEERCHPEAGTTAAGWRLLSRVRREAPQAFSDVVRFPSVAAWAGGSVTGLAPNPGHLSLIAAAAAIRAGLSFAVPLSASALAPAPAGDLLHLPSLGTAVLPPRPRRRQVLLRRRGDRTEVPGQLVLPRRLDRDGPGWQALPAVDSPAGRLVIDDAYPYQMPENLQLSGRLSPGLRSAWRRRAAGGVCVLFRHHGRTATQVSAIIRAIIPLVSQEDGLRSLTSRLAYGGVALSFPDDDLSMALTLAHEVQHSMLSALMDLVPLVRDGAKQTHYVPWRPDPRPLGALLQGLYAHLEVARFWRQRREGRLGDAAAWQADVEFARCRAACGLVAGSIRGNPELTRCGAVFVDEMVEVTRAWRDERVRASPALQAQREISEHREKWDIGNRGS